MKNMLYSWTFPDTKNRGQLWYSIVFSIIIGLVIWGFLTKQYGMSFIILLLSGLVFYIENNSSDTIAIEITELGMKVDEFFYDYSKIESYTLIYEGENAIICRLNLNKKGIKVMDLKIDNTVALELKGILPEFIKENEKEDFSFTDRMIRIMKL
ncbi:MAG: hypothetical protein Q9M94_01325 [Candidatus Gracilibacteria bacterium]|nr:hypothetical protein [Candidatus Gracilibacteria bacterium]